MSEPNITKSTMNEVTTKLLINLIEYTLVQPNIPFTTDDGPDPLSLYGLVERSDGKSVMNGILN